MDIDKVEKLLSHSDGHVQDEALVYLMEQTKKGPSKEKEFARIFSLLAQCKNLSPPLYSAFTELLKYDDIRTLSLSSFLAQVDSLIMTDEELAELDEESRRAQLPQQATNAENSFLLLKIIKPLACTGHNYFAVKGQKKPRSDEEQQAEHDKLTEAQRSLFEKAWMRLLAKMPALPKHVTPLVLKHVIEHVIAQFRAQFLLLDFFAYCYDLVFEDESAGEGTTGESETTTATATRPVSDGDMDVEEKVLEERRSQNAEIALLAVQGLFVLTYHHNLDYPDFFPKFYRLLMPRLLRSPNAQKLVLLVYEYLQNPTLPSYVLMSFMKRLVRLSLQTSPSITTLILCVVYNLMAMNPLTFALVHNEPDSKGPSPLLLNTTVAMLRDPFLFAETDMLASKASESSLWELHVLMNHHSPAVSAAAKSFKNISTHSLHDLKLHVNKDYHDAIQAESRKIKQGIPMEFVEPTAFFAASHFPGFDF